MQTIIKEIYQIFKASSGVETDTRKIKPESLFFCLKGENFNANEFASEALDKGAKAVVIDEEKYFQDERTILVDNCLDTLQKLANYHRLQFDIPIIAITGTNGKTTTKELINAALATEFQVHATSGNFNNHIGVPLTLLSMPGDTQIAVIEMGANHPSEIRDLCNIAEPTYGLITNIGKAHLEGFGSLQGVINTKNELYDFIYQRGGVVFVDSDNPLLMDLSSIIFRTTYGSGLDSFFKGEMRSSTPFISLSFHNKTLNTNLLGKYNFTNIMAALAIGSYFGVEDDVLITAISDYLPANKRSQFLETKENKIYLDAYNANPTSTQNALESFVTIDIPNKLIILGDMLELGEDSYKEHQQIITLLKTYQIETILVGPEFVKVNQDTNTEVFKDVIEANEYLKAKTLKNRFILLKGSRGIGLEKLLENL